MTWRHYIDRNVAKALRIYVRAYSFFKSGRLSTNIKLGFYKAPIRSVVTYACPTWEYEVEAHLLKLQSLQNRVLRATGNIDRGTPVSELHVAFKFPYMYDYMTKLCRTQAEVILNYVHQNVGGTGQGEARHRKYERLKLGGGQAHDILLTNYSFRVVT
jgi:hypothetical protein